MKTTPRWARSRPLARRSGGSSNLGYQVRNAIALPTLAGPAINEQTSLTIAGVYNAVSIISNSVAVLNAGVAERTESGGRRPATELPLFDLLARAPNERNTAFRFRRTLMVHGLTAGNGYAEIELHRKRPSALHLLEPRNVEPRVGDDGKLVYHLIREKTDLPAARVIHLANLGWDGIRGYSPITLARETLGLAKAQEQYQSGLMGNSAAANGFIMVPQVLKEPDKNRLRSDYEAMHRGAENAGTVGILDGGSRWVATSFSPADAELILSRGFSQAEIARIFCLPQHMIGLLDHATFSNIEQQLMEFYTFTLLPWLTNLEQEMDMKFFSKSERMDYFVYHDIKTLLRADTAATTAADQADFKMGVKSQNDILRGRGENPIDHPNADKHYVEANNMVAIEDLPDTGKVAANPADPVIDPAEVPPAAEADAERSRNLAVDQALESLSGGLRCA